MMNDPHYECFMASIPQYLSASFFTLCISTASILLAQPAKSEVGASRGVFFGNVSEIDPNGSIVISGHGVFRVWGIVPVGRELEVLVGQNLLCTPVGKINGRATTVVVTCVMGFEDNFFDKSFDKQQDVSNFLIANGRALELCAESLGVYGTCVNP